MITYDQALTRINDVAVALDDMTVPLHEALGLTSREKVISSVSIPPFDNSAMDGFAFKSDETASASSQNPIKFKIVSTALAGEVPAARRNREANSVWEITTGAPIPPGYDGVEKIENVEVLANREILLKERVLPKQHVRFSGEDFREGDPLFDVGTPIMPEHIMALACLGRYQLKVSRPLKAAVISTGGELERCQTENPTLGKIRNSSGPYLMAELARLNVKSQYMGMVEDDPKVFFRVMGKVFESKPDVIITTGAVSMGRHDFITSAIKDLGADIQFHKVAVRPGKPILFARFPAKDSVTLPTAFFGLPGNPVSTVVGLRFFVEPYLRSVLGSPKEKPNQVPLIKDIKKPQGLRCFFKARVKIDDRGQAGVEILPDQASFMIHPLLKANAWAILAEEGDLVKAKSLIDVMPSHSWANQFAKESEPHE